jgi:hypothetical protein
MREKENKGEGKKSSGVCFDLYNNSGEKVDVLLWDQV